MFLRRIASRLVLLAFALLLPAVCFAEPAIWVVKGPHATVYLFGTIHILPKDKPWRTVKIDKAMNASSTVCLEVTNADDLAAAQPIMMQLGTDPSHPLSTKLTKEQLAKLDEVARSAGVPNGEASLEPLRPWLAALSLSVAPAMQAGFDPKSGVELTIKPEFVKGNKAVVGFETIEQQLHFFADMTQKAEVDYLNLTIKDFGESKARLNEMVNAWYAGDTATLDNSMEGSFRNDYPDLYKRLIIDRNLAWMPKLTEFLKGDSTTFVAVGAGHLTGQNGVIALLEKAGYKVERL